MKLALGTAQFGMNYGISNTQGQVSISEIKHILMFAQQQKIQVIDTAAAYGESEQRLGQCIENKDTFSIITKIPPLNNTHQPITPVIEKSLINLKLNHLYGVLFHRTEDLTANRYGELKKLQQRGIIKKIGVSVYHPQQAFDVISQYPLSLIQVPLNLFDQRFGQSGCLDWLVQEKVEIHARSLFLQGLLLMAAEKRPAYFQQFLPFFERFDNYIKQLALNPLTLALQVIPNYPQVSQFVIGVCSQQQLLEIIQHYAALADNPIDITALNCDLQGLINPSLWPR
jgi:aryl-alcohol dehydrogenase-like predicted oxidoreductase